MKALTKRVDTLEGKAPVLSPAVKAWLGWPRSDDEKQALDVDVGVDQDFDAIDTSDWSQEVKEWLGVD